MLIERKPAVSGRALFKGAAGVQPGSTGLFLSYHWHYSLQEQQKKKRPIGKNFLEFWSHSTKVKALVISDVSFREETTAWSKKIWNRWVDFSNRFDPKGAQAWHGRLRCFNSRFFGAFQHTFLSNGLASRVFIFCSGLVSAFHDFLFIVSRDIRKFTRSYPVHAPTKVVWRNQGLISYVSTTGLWQRKRQEDSYLKNYTRLYPTLPTQVVM